MLRSAIRRAACARRVGIVLVVSCALGVSGICSAATWLAKSVDLGAVPHGVRVDAARGLIYLSVPEANRVYVADRHSLAVTRKVYVGFHPTGIDLSADGNTLYTALNQAGAIGVYDLANDTGMQFDISIPLGDPRTSEVIETSPGIVYAAANPCSNGFAWIVRVDIAAQTAARVADQDIIRCAPVFAHNAGGRRLYIAESLGGSLYALDIGQATAPVVGGDNFQTPGMQSAQGFAVSPAGDKLVGGNGVVTSTSTFLQYGSAPIGPGASIFSTDGTQIVRAYDALPVTVYRYDANTLAPIDSIPTSCYANDGTLYPNAIEELPDATGWAIISGTWLCTLEQIPDGIFIDTFGA
jgi:hypothetical protein